MMETEVMVIDKSKSRKRYLICGILIGILLAATLAIIICAFITTVRSNDEMGEDEAVDIFESLNNASNPHTNLTNEDVFIYAFNIFDKNDDGFLDPDEFVHYYEMKLGRSKIFELIDVDNDDILSYPECVAFVTEMFKVEIIFGTFLMHTIAPVVASVYNYAYEYNQTKDRLFIEYSTMILFFDPYDIDKNGYIRHDEFILISSQTSFLIADVDEDNKISKEELFTLFYGTETQHSWNGIKKQLVGDSVNEVVDAMHNIEINSVLVESTKGHIQLCPSQLYTSDNYDALVRRRLAQCAIIIIIQTK